MNIDVTVLVDEASRNVSVSEGEAVSICARTLGRADFVISASFQTYAIPGSALAEDFSMAPQQFNFPANSAALQCVSVQTTDNSIVERDEQFWVQLAIAGSDNDKVSLGTHVSVNVTINDNDCEL